MNLDKLKSTLAVRNYRQRERERSRLIPAILGDGAGHVMVGTDAGRLYVRLLGENDYVIQVSNATSIQLIEGLVVDLERIWSTGASQYRVVGYSALVTYVNNPYANMPGAHGGTHERRDFGTGNGTLPPDPVDVYTPMLTSVRVQVQNPAGLTLRISAGWYKDARGFAHYYDGGNSSAFTIPGLLEQRVDLLYFDVAGTPTILQGAVSMGSTPTCPACPRQATPLKYIWLRGGMTAIDSEIYFYDPRLIVSSVETAGQLETWTYANATARTGASGFVSTDIGCIAYQSDTQTYWRLLTTAPTWVQCGGPPSTSDIGAAIHAASVDTPLNADEFGYYDVVDSVLKKVAWSDLKAAITGGWVAPDNPDEPPASPDPDDDEFETGSLDGSWTVINPDPAKFTYDVANGLLHTKQVLGTTSTDRNFSFLKTAPVGTWTYRGKFTLNSGMIDAAGIGLAVAVAATGKINLGVCLSYTAGGVANPLFEIYNVTNQVWSANTTTLEIASNPFYLELEYDGSNLIWRSSKDGFNFAFIGTITTAAFLGATPDQVGIGIHPYQTNAGYNWDFTVDWFRRVA